MAVEVSKVSKYYGEQCALNEVSFTLKNGEIVGFLGPNGAGKSTMMKIIVGFLNATEGQVNIGGLDIATDTLKAQQKIGYLPENNPMYLEMYVREYLSFLANVRKVSIDHVDKLIEQTGLTPEVGKKIGQLSKGYRQRVGLAAALLHNPEVLILDEPTTGLDPNQLVEIRALIKKAGSDKTVLFSSHIMQEIEAICDRVILINKGVIVADELLENIKQHRKQLLEVTFKDLVDKESLSAIPHLTKIESEDQLTWHLTFSTKEDMRSVVFDFAKDNEIKILQLSSKEKNLEELFREMTS